MLKSFSASNEATTARGVTIFKNGYISVELTNVYIRTLPGIKPVWSQCIRDRITKLSRLTNILVKILVSTFSSDIGQ